MDSWACWACWLNRQMRTEMPTQFTWQQFVMGAGVPVGSGAISVFPGDPWRFSGFLCSVLRYILAFSSVLIPDFSPSQLEVARCSMNFPAFFWHANFSYGLTSVLRTSYKFLEKNLPAIKTKTKQQHQQQQKENRKKGEKVSGHTARNNQAGIGSQK